MTAKELRKKYIDFFVERKHKRIPNLSLIPENDPTTLFISAGMQPLVPYLMGEPHPLGKRLVSLQRCLRTGDIEEVGDISHHTFFEMLGNWSLGDYWKKESLAWSFEFLTKTLGFNPQRLHVTIFEGDKNVSRDEESEKIWLSLGIPKERIYSLPKEDNWWEAGKTGPGGPDSEIFYDIGKPACGSDCRPGDGCGRFFEVWNNVFMEYNRKPDGTYEKLKQKNVDTGMGVERTIAVLEGKDDDYQTELFLPIIQKIEELSGKRYREENNKKPMRIIADHLRAATFAIADGVMPSNKDRGYIIRRLIRRSVVQMMQLDIVPLKLVPAICGQIIDIYKDSYFVDINSYEIHPIIRAEVDKFLPKLHRASKLLQTKPLSGKLLFDLFQTHGLPFEVAQDLLEQWGKKIGKETKEEYEKEFEKHQTLSRKGAIKKFSGGLADHSEVVTKLHTATHLLHQALREILGDYIKQSGSNITSKRLRFDFTHSKKLTPEEIKKVEKMVNEKIKQNLKVSWETMTLDQAKKDGALAFFEKKYEEKVKVYLIGDPVKDRQIFSKEVCAGPHVDFTRVLGRFRIVKEESAGTGIRRIYGMLNYA